MRRLWIWFIAAVVGLGVYPSSYSQSTSLHSSKFPRTLSPEYEDGGFKHAKSPSDLLLNALLATSEAKDAEPELKGLSREKLRGLFRVVEVQLGPKDEQDFVAVGSGPLSGTDSDWFWILRVKSGEAKVLLFLNGLQVSILKHQTDGYSDIRGDWATAGYSGWGIFKFNGQEYKLFRSKSRENKD